MNNSSLAAQGVAKEPMTAAPPSLDGHGWLVVLNLAASTFSCVVALLFAVDAVRAIRRNWGSDRRNRPVSIWRYPLEAGSMIAAICACIAVRLYVAQKDRAAHRWNIDLPVSALTLLFTASAVICLWPDPALALI